MVQALGRVTATAVTMTAPAPGATVTGSAAWVAQAYQYTENGPDYTPQQSDVPGPQRAPFGTSSDGPPCWRTKAGRDTEPGTRVSE